MPATYEPIATQTLASAAASITFSSIPATYTDLRLVFTGTQSVVTDIFYWFNNDQTNLYSQTTLNGDGTTASSGTNLNRANIDVNALKGEGSLTIPKMITIDVFSYIGSTYKTALFNFIGDENGGIYTAVVLGVSLYRSTSAITSINIGPASGNLAIGTTATLYGIKAA